MTLGLAFNVSAQFGVHAGVVGTGIHSSEFGIDPDFKSGMGFKVGVGYTKNYGGFGIGVELNYVNQKTREVSQTAYNTNEEDGHVLSLDGLGEDETIVSVVDVNEDPYAVYMIQPEDIENRSYDYISLPILAHFYLGPVNIHVGAQASYLLGGYAHRLHWEINPNESELYGRYPNGQQAFDLEYTEDEQTIKPFYTDGLANGTYSDDDGFEPVKDEFFDFTAIDVAAVIGLEIGSDRGLYGSARLTYSITPIMNMAIINDANEWGRNFSVDDSETYYEMYGEDVFSDKYIAMMDKFITTSFAIGYRF